MLTGGSLDDLAGLASYWALAETLSNRSESVADYSPVVFQINDQRGKPIGGCEVQIDGLKRWNTLHAKTKSNGKIILLDTLDGVRHGSEKELTLRLRPPQRQVWTTHQIRVHAQSGTPHVVQLQHYRAEAPQKMDLAFVIDTTGSMGDELKYCQVEIQGIARAIARRFPNVQQRYALVVYRDRGDDYVVHKYDFTDSLQAFERTLSQCSASGGGDYPEAVERGLEAAGQLQWQSGNVARVCFHLADAPPHDRAIERTFKAVSALRTQGVALYPVAASGVDKLAEWTMRTEALMTGSNYLFLTDDAGVGNPHATPTAGRFDVETLKELMIRMAVQELTGFKLSSRRGEVLRTAWGEDGP
ncbi:MAG: VWA domain-containing protein [Phycisphaerales bacterium]|nr:VWA domain-containing protein [Phycisphaerales bacterium]